MSTFAVTVRKLSKVWSHPNADRLELAQVNDCDYQFVIPKGQYKEGDEVVYFPVDSILPQDVIAKMGLTGKLAGKDKNRLKTVKLRDQISQGLVTRPTDFLWPTKGDSPWKMMSPEEITTALGVTKYDPPPIPCMTGNLVRMPADIPVYDIEGAENYPAIVAALMDVQVYISEKLEGMNSWFSVEGEAVTFGQRHNRIEPIEDKEHDFLRVSKPEGLFDLGKKLSAKFGGKKVTLRGEYVGPGVQKNIYKLAENRVYLFDLLVSQGPGDIRYLNPDEFLFEVGTGPLPYVVPPISLGKTLREWLNGRTIREASNGMSLLLPTQRREGIVIKPMVEGRNGEIGRLLIKQRSPEYLAESEF